MKYIDEKGEELDIEAERKAGRWAYTNVQERDELNQPAFTERSWEDAEGKTHTQRTPKMTALADFVPFGLLPEQWAAQCKRNDGASAVLYEVPGTARHSLLIWISNEAYQDEALRDRAVKQALPEGAVLVGAEFTYVHPPSEPSLTEMRYEVEAKLTYDLPGTGKLGFKEWLTE